MRITLPWLLALWLAVSASAAGHAQTAQQKVDPKVGQPGKDVVWVPTPPELVEKMLDMAQVTPRDYVIDLGSGDGRNVIAAARRGARALGIEYNPDMVALSRSLALAAGVGDTAAFVQGDMFESDFSEATVLALFLLPDNLRRLRPKFLDLAPGTRIVANTFGIDGWEPDETDTVGGECEMWCKALLWIVPARVEGVWQLPAGELTLTQEFQMITGTLASGSLTTPIVDGRLRGDLMTFRAGEAAYSGRINGDTIEGDVQLNGKQNAWQATRASRALQQP